jgi:hypothetical protein
MLFAACAAVGFGASRVLRRPVGRAQAASAARNLAGPLGTRRGLSAPELQRACFSEMVRHVRVTRQGRTHAPSATSCSLHPDDLAVVDEARRWFTEGLARRSCRRGLRDNGWVLDGPVEIEFQADPARHAGVPAATSPHAEPRPHAGAPAVGPPAAGRAGAAHLGPGRTFVLIRTDTGERIPLRGPVLTIGRSRDRTVTVDDTRVSRIHARIEPAPGRLGGGRRGVGQRHHRRRRPVVANRPHALPARSAPPSASARWSCAWSPWRGDRRAPAPWPTTRIARASPARCWAAPRTGVRAPDDLVLWPWPACRWVWWPSGWWHRVACRHRAHRCRACGSPSRRGRRRPDRAGAAGAAGVVVLGRGRLPVGQRHLQPDREGRGERQLSESPARAPTTCSSGSDNGAAAATSARGSTASAPTRSWCCGWRREGHDALAQPGPVGANPATGEEGRLNATYNAGPANLIAAVTQNFGIPIDRYLEIDFVSFAGLVDSFGGIDVDFANPASTAVGPGGAHRRAGPPRRRAGAGLRALPPLHRDHRRPGGARGRAARRQPHPAPAGVPAGDHGQGRRQAEPLHPAVGRRQDVGRPARRRRHDGVRRHPLRLADGPPEPGVGGAPRGTPHHQRRRRGARPRPGADEVLAQFR